MKIPTITGIIRRRILVNYRVTPDAGHFSFMAFGADNAYVSGKVEAAACRFAYYDIKRLAAASTFSAPPELRFTPSKPYGTSALPAWDTNNPA